VGQGIGGDVVVGQAVARGTEADLHGGRLDAGFPDAVTPYNKLLGDLAAKSAGYAATPVTGTVDITETAVTLTGDGVSPLQVFSVDGATLGAIEGVGRSLQVLGVPAGATAVVNLTGPAVDLDVDSLLAPDGTPLDPTNGSAFSDLATHLLWNAPTASTVDVGGAAQLPGSLLVPTSPSTTTLAGAGTNGRILVAGDLVHTGTGQLHSYPLQVDADLRCGPALAHLGTLTLNVQVQDPDKVVDPERFFLGEFTCDLDGTDVTPKENTWRVRATADAKVLSDQIPVDAVCVVTEQLKVPPFAGYEWTDPTFSPEQVTVAKRDPRKVTVTNRARALPPEPEPTNPPATLTSNPDEEESPEPTEEPAPPPVTPTVPEPTPTPEPAPPSAAPTPQPTETPTPTAEAAPPQADPPRPSAGPGPVTTTAPFTLRGSFVWGPLLLLSVLTLLLRTRRRPKRLH
jgi:choice-of-anchor A domain-containing protein